MKRSQTRDLLPTSITLSDLASLPDVIQIVENITHPRIPSLRQSVKISRVYTSRVSSKLLTLIGGWTWRNKKIGVIKRDTIIKLSKDEEVFELLSATPLLSYLWCSGAMTLATVFHNNAFQFSSSFIFWIKNKSAR